MYHTRFLETRPRGMVPRSIYVNFASGFVLGKSLQLAAPGFLTIASGHTLSQQSLKDLCEHSLIILRALSPQEVELPVQPCPVVAYADGAFDKNKGYLGSHSDSDRPAHWCQAMFRRNSSGLLVGGMERVYVGKRFAYSTSEDCCWFSTTKLLVLL